MDEETRAKLQKLLDWIDYRLDYDHHDRQLISEYAANELSWILDGGDKPRDPFVDHIKVGNS